MLNVGSKTITAVYNQILFALVDLENKVERGYHHEQKRGVHDITRDRSFMIQASGHNAPGATQGCGDKIRCGTNARRNNCTAGRRELEVPAHLQLGQFVARSLLL